MPTIDALIIAAIVLAFIVFGAVLAWADYQTRQARRPTGQRVAEVAKKAGVAPAIQPQTAQRKELSTANTH